MICLCLELEKAGARNRGKFMTPPLIEEDTAYYTIIEILQPTVK